MNKLFGKKTIIASSRRGRRSKAEALEHGSEVGICCGWRGRRAGCRERRGLRAPGAPEQWKTRCSVGRPSAASSSSVWAT